MNPCSVDGCGKPVSDQCEECCAGLCEEHSRRKFFDDVTWTTRCDKCLDKMPKDESDEFRNPFDVDAERRKAEEQKP